MGIAETLEYIHNIKWRGSKPGLERTQELLKALGNPEKQLKFVHVAGTNGKGSTAACIASVLKEAGYKTGLFISPYIVCFNERMQVNGEYISDEDLESLIDQIRPFANAMEDSPTEFELITALAMLYFQKEECDIVILEVGMGGRLDSTNVIDTPELAVITAIGYDHVKELGPTLCDIAREKSGIIKQDGDVLIYGGEWDVVNVFECVSSERGAKLQKADFSRIKKQEVTLDHIELELDPYGKILLPLVGAYQPKNAALAITALEILRAKGYKISDKDIINGIENVKWPGRFEVLGRNPAFILDGSHNPQGMEATVESLQQHFGDKEHCSDKDHNSDKVHCGDHNNLKRNSIIFIFGAMADKDIDEMILHIAPFAKIFLAVKPENPRAMESYDLAEKLKRFGIPVTDCGTVGNGVSEALKTAGEGDIICALGSFYMSSDVRTAYSAFRG